MKTANEVLLEVVHLKESGGGEPERILELLADLARAVVELEHHYGREPAKEPADVAADPV